jgi:hypothetical protein
MKLNYFSLKYKTKMLLCKVELRQCLPLDNQSYVKVGGKWRLHAHMRHSVDTGDLGAVP